MHCSKTRAISYDGFTGFVALVNLNAICFFYVKSIDWVCLSLFSKRFTDSWIRYAVATKNTFSKKPFAIVTSTSKFARLNSTLMVTEGGN